MKLLIRGCIIAALLQRGSIFLTAQSSQPAGPLVDRATGTTVELLEPVTTTPRKPTLVVLDKKSPSSQSARLWGVSIGTLAAATSFDAFSSMGKSESNPLLRSGDGTFGVKGIALKAGLAGGSVAPQIALRRRHDLRRIFEVANFVQTGMFTAIGIHNMGIRAIH